MSKLLKHFLRMQSMGARYSEPTPAYIDIDGKHSDAVGWLEDAGRNRLFAHDMIYMLDGPEQREAQAEASFDYIAEAKLTLSPSWHGDKVAKHRFTTALNNGIEAANALDKIKKTLFYGRDNNLDPASGQASIQDLPARMNAGDADVVNIIHAIIGKFTEAGELLEALKGAMNGARFDTVNAIEEVGDGFWYDAILLDECEGSFGDAMQTNIAKLRKRFPDRFTEYDAQNRNLVAERELLEAGVGRPVYDPRELHKPINERAALMPGEEASRQTIRASDLDGASSGMVDASNQYGLNPEAD